ncbi:MAG: U32 family peptidase [Acholeplasma sp.]|nr:U32 family peptidase [Acholeplasma sp.]
MKVELLAPAGDLERLKIAFTYGADAVYLGGNLFGLRANAVNFTLEEIKEGVIYAHNLNKKVYVTVNIVLHDKELDLLDDYLKSLSEIGVDAIIISDLGIIPVAKKYNLDVHISTQQSTLNKEAIKFYQKLGVTRVVLAREASKEEIEENVKTGMEIEIFIHGAMCASYSGRCVLSNYLTNRDANRGGCSQICRWDFDLIGDGKLVSSIYYIATVISIYRKVIDEYCNNKDNYTYNINYEKVLTRCANRDCYVQFFDGNYGSDCNYYNERIEISNQDFLGLVLDYDEDNKMLTIEQRNYFEVLDNVEFLTPTNIGIPFTIKEMYDLDGNSLDVARHPKQIIKIPCEINLSKNSMMRVKILG